MFAASTVLLVALSATLPSAQAVQRRPTSFKEKFKFWPSKPAAPSPPPPVPPGVNPVCVGPAQRCSDRHRYVRTNVFHIGWTYQLGDDKCVRAEFSGCGTGDNFFGSQDECEETCKQGGGGDEDVCTLPQADQVELPPGTVVCQALIFGWTYDEGANSCREVTVTGCSAPDGNFFNSQEACEGECVASGGDDGGGDGGDGDGDGIEEDVCDLPLVENVPPPPGTVTCQAIFSGWSFDKEAGKCVQVGITGCGPPRGNFFDTEEECDKACVPH